MQTFESDNIYYKSIEGIGLSDIFLTTVFKENKTILFLKIFYFHIKSKFWAKLRSLSRL